MGIRDEEYNKIVKQLKKESIVSLKNTDGNIYTFFFKGKDLHCCVNGEPTTMMEVMKQSDVFKQQMKGFQSHMSKQIKADNPTMKEEVVEAYADVITEANESIKNLINGGIEPAMAKALVSKILENHEELDEILCKNE